MNVTFTGRGRNVSDKLRDYATEKISKAERFNHDIDNVEVVFREEATPRVVDRHAVEVTAKGKLGVLRATGTGADWFAAIDQAAHRFENQVRKLKDRMVDHNKHKSDPEPVPEAPAPEFIDSEPHIVKPLTPAEAVIELEEHHLQFLLFTDATTKRPTVLYRRKDGNWGLQSIPK